MTATKAVITDYIGTLTNARKYKIETSRIELHQTLNKSGFKTMPNVFLRAYKKAHAKHCIIRYERMLEVTNAVWVSETLNTLGYKTDAEDSGIKAALNIFFQDYLNTLELRPYARRLLRNVTKNCKLGLISNFIYAPVIYSSLRELRINQFFNAVIISEAIGWRKPHERIFQTAIERLQVRAEETIYVGDSPLEDVKGAKTVGMKTVFVLSQFSTLEDFRKMKEQPDIVAEDLQEVTQKLNLILNPGTKRQIL